MNKCMTLAAIAGLTTIAAAGPVEEFSLSLVGPADGLSGSTITIDVYGDSSFGTHLLGGEFNLTSSGDTEAISDIRWTPAGWSTANGLGEYDGNGNHNGVIFGQLIVFTDLFDFLPGAGSELGSRIGSFQVDFHGGDVCLIDFGLSTSPNPDRFALKAADVDEVNRTVQTMDSSEGNLTLNGLRINALCPSPSGVALLGFGGLAVTRRRR